MITVKTFPIPSKKHDELVCTAGVTEDGDFIRLYPINFRELPFDKQYRKYQWIEVDAVKHTGHDSRKESYRPDCATLRTLGEPLGTDRGSWAERAKFVLKKKVSSMEELAVLQGAGRTSLGIMRPKKVHDLAISPAEPDWAPRFKAELEQQRIFEVRRVTLQPPRKVPYRFRYVFECDDKRCRGHRMMIEDWEVGALYWNLVDQGASPDGAAKQVKAKFLNELCSPMKDTHFFVGTILAHPGSWVVIGVFWPNLKREPSVDASATLF